MQNWPFSHNRKNLGCCSLFRKICEIFERIIIESHWKNTTYQYSNNCSIFTSTLFPFFVFLNISILFLCQSCLTHFSPVSHFYTPWKHDTGLKLVKTNALKKLLVNVVETWIICFCYWNINKFDQMLQIASASLIFECPWYAAWMKNTVDNEGP